MIISCSYSIPNIMIIRFLCVTSCSYSIPNIIISDYMIKSLYYVNIYF